MIMRRKYIRWGGVTLEESNKSYIGDKILAEKISKRGYNTRL